MAEKKTEPEPTYVTVNGEELETTDIEFRGQKYTLRELTVEENEEIDEGAKQKDGTYNGTLLLKLAIVKSIVAPSTTMDDLQKWGGKKYLVLSRAYNKLNSLPQDAQGNA